MRLPTLPPDQLIAEQRALYDRNVEQIAYGFTAFKTTREDGALLGPWGVFLHEPAVGQAHYDRDRGGHCDEDGLRPPPSRWRSSSSGLASRLPTSSTPTRRPLRRRAWTPAKIATLAAGGRPLDLTPEESCAFDVASALLDGGVLPGATYRAARDMLGQGALNELVLWVGTYAQVAIVLNAFDVSSEEVLDR